MGGGRKGGRSGRKADAKKTAFVRQRILVPQGFFGKADEADAKITILVLRRKSSGVGGEKKRRKR